MKNLVIFLIFLFGHSINLNAGGISTWSQTTPYGNIIWFESAYPSEWNYITCGQSKTNSDFTSRDITLKIDSWYFYKGYVAGILSDSAKYFIFNEQTCQMRIFQGKPQFLEYCQSNDIKPNIWTRWHNDFYGYFYSNVECGFCIISNLVRSLTALLITLAVLFFAIKLKNRITYILLLLWLVILTARLILDMYPQSL